MAPTVVAVVAAHAVEYAGIDGAAGAGVRRARPCRRGEGAERPRRPVRDAWPSFAAADGQLTVTIGGESVSQPLPA